MICGTIHPNGMCVPHDEQGCRLEMGHSGPHEFVDARGITYEWESDMACEECNPDECECTIYWRKQYRSST